MKENEETQTWLPGVWLVDADGKGKHHIANADEIKGVVDYAKMAKDDYKLATFIRVKFQSYISNTIKVEPNGTINYALPSAVQIAQDVLKFLAMDSDERRSSINKAIKTNTNFDSEGNVLDANGTIIHHAFSKEATACKIQELQKQIEDYTRLLGERCIADL